MSGPKHTLVRNVFSNWAGMAVGLVITFFMSPFLVHTLGKSEYGIWALVFSIVYYSSLIDAGMKQSLARHIPKYYALKDFDKLNQVINSGTFLYLIAGTLVILITLAVAYIFLGAFNVTPELLPLMRKTLLIIGINQAILFFFMAATAIGPFHRYDINNIVAIPTGIINALVIVYFLKKGYGLVAMALINLVTNVVRSIIRRIYQQVLVPQIKFHVKYISRERIRELLGYGIVSFFIVVSWMVVFNTDNIVIGLFLTTTAVTYYSIAAGLINHLRSLIAAIGVPLVPAMSHYQAQGDMTEISNLFIKVTRYLYFFSTVACVMILIFGDNFIYLWMGPDFTKTVGILYILIIPASIYLPQTTANSVLLGIGKHRTLLYILITEAVLNLILSLVLVRPLGIYGVALGTAISQVMIYTYVFPYVFHRVIEGNLGIFYGVALRTIATSAAVTAPLSLLIDTYNPVGGWIGLILSLAIAGMAAIFGFWKWALYPEDKAKIRLKFSRRK
jgi:O-antigen/teichoic acid export membrane protein